MDCKAFALLTDFGLDDAYVGQMKGVLLSQVPGAQIIDISHGIRPHNVLQAGLFLSASWPYLPQEAICLAVVDPGVGSDRAVLILQKAERYVLAPDNGLISQVLLHQGENRLFRLKQAACSSGISWTFHGRDLFAPAGAKLSQGVRPDELGEVIDPSRVVHLKLAEPEIRPGVMSVSVGHVDRFGNCLLNLPEAFWDRGLSSVRRLKLRKPLERPVRPARTYADLHGTEIGLIPGSQGVLELAVNQGSCAYELGLDIGDLCLFEGDFDLG